MKIHLEAVYGGPFCGLQIRGAPEDLKVDPKIKNVTCLRCKRRFYRYPINAKVKGVL